MPLIGWFYDGAAPFGGEWIIFGAGALGISAHAQIARAGGTVIAYIDNAAEKQGTRLLGTRISPAHELPHLLQHKRFKHHLKILVLLVTRLGQRQIKRLSFLLELCKPEVF